jgi:hypothetical protein
VVDGLNIKIIVRINRYIILGLLIIGCQKEPMEPIAPVQPCNCELVVDVQIPSATDCETDYLHWDIPFVDTAKKLNVNLPRFGQFTLWSAFGNFNNNDTSDYVIVTEGGTNIENPPRGEVVIVVDDVIVIAIPSPQLKTRKVVTEDLNQDGIDDIILFGTGPDTAQSSGDITTVIYMYASGSYRVQEIGSISGYYHTGAYGVTNGNAEILEIDSQAFTNVSNGYVNLLQSSGTSEVWTNSDSNITTHHVARTFHSELYDFDKDGVLDLILGGHEWEEDWMATSLRKVVWQTHILRGLGPGQFDVDNPIILPQILNWGVITDFDIYDIDRDGNVEIIITRTTGRDGVQFELVDNEYYDGIKVQILKGEGFNWYQDQALESPNIIGLGTFIWPHKSTIYDVNGDCLLDIIPESDKLNAASFVDFNSVRGIYYEQQDNGQFNLKYKN